MKPRVYLETSVISYLTARPCRDLVVTAHQQLTREWWERRRSNFEVFVSRAVIQEAAAGDPQAAALRLNEIANLPKLALTAEALALADGLLERHALPPQSGTDALHIALATAHGMDFLITWNCRHIANGEAQQAIASVCGLHGYAAPTICTPEELMGD